MSLLSTIASPLLSRSSLSSPSPSLSHSLSTPPSPPTLSTVSTTTTTKRYYNFPYTSPPHGEKPVNPPRVLITGSLGQIGTELASMLRAKFGAENVVTSDVRRPTSSFRDKGPWKYCDVTDISNIYKLVVDENIDWLIHLSSILSAKGEQNMKLALDINIRGVENALQVAKDHNLRIFAPSSIAAFGPSTPLENVPNEVIQRPQTIYGVSKVYAELLGEYYHHKYGVDFRSLRYPGILSADVAPGGGTTDYAVDIFHSALKGQTYECFVENDVSLPMMYIDDCLKGTMQFLETPDEMLTRRTYNLSAISFTPQQFYEQIRQKLPEDNKFSIAYKPDFRNEIAKTWPRVLDDSVAREDWNWQHDYGLNEMTDAMLKGIGKNMKKTEE